MAIEVKFWIYLVDNDLIELSEQDIESHFEQYSSCLHETETIEGAVAIILPNNKEVIIRDELWVIVQNFCFNSILSLLREKKECFIYHYFSSYGQIVLIPSTDFVRIMGDEVPTESFTTSELLPALYYCGERFINLLRKLQAAGRNDAAIEHLESFAKEALQVLQANNMLS
ncbi:hypothetical protein [Anabaena azotica]|uniref:Uncharacterized protein n=1 Tax=Anabaena azotica FACHB-119 TaxID=947527 RepID=A0ABR8DD99_9NOST|nr:hypothetical protein [Anabaena azotica]MBD2504566.1 hypothetical protein [Anabaena azotica FACHB-119]